MLDQNIQFYTWRKPKMNNTKTLSGFLTTGSLSGLSWMATELQSVAAFQYIQLILSIISSAITAAIGLYGLVLLIIKIVKKIKKGESINPEDVNNVVKKVEEVAENISDVVTHIKKTKGGDEDVSKGE